MKKTVILISLILALFVSKAQEEWTILHPYPTIKTLNDAHFNTEQQGWVVGWEGLIMYTEDGGDTWEFQHSNPDESFRSIFFIDENEGWVLGWNCIYHTSDAGNSWEQQNLPAHTGDLTDIFFINQETGWIVGAYKIVLKTIDGGENWIKIMNTYNGNIRLQGVSFNDELRGCAVGSQNGISDGYTMITNDGGITWSETTPPDHYKFNKIVFVDSLTAWACGDRGGLIKTIDAGYTWIDKSNVYYNSLNDIHFFNENQGILLDGHSVRLTYNAGATWDSVISVGATANQRKFTCWDDDKIISVGGTGSMSKSVDGGSTWMNLNKGMSSSIGQIAFFNSHDGLAIAGNWGDEYLIRTSDGGCTWQHDTLIENGPFYKLRIDGSSCYLLNDASQLIRTTNAGEDWEIFNVPDLTSYYFDMNFVNEEVVYMCSSEGIFVKSIDGGETWQDISFADEHYLTSMFFISEDEGWLIDYIGKEILRTTDGGESWTSRTLGEEYVFQPASIFFVNENEGFSSTGEGVLFKTINGGDSWEEFYVFSTGSNSKIYFTNETEGWYKTGHSVYHTYDGGISWINKQSFSYVFLKDLFFLDNMQGWLGGGNGLVAVYNSITDINKFTKDNASVSVFPNPAYEDVEIKLHDKSDEIIDIKMFNLQGRRIKHFSNLLRVNSFKLNVMDLVSGAYVLHITTANSQYLVKIIVQ